MQATPGFEPTGIVIHMPRSRYRVSMRTRLTAALIIATSLALAGCSSGPAEIAPTASAPAAESMAPAASEPASASVDRTEELRQLAGDEVVRAEEVEPGRITVETSITDPRTGEGSTEAVAAIAICEAAVSLGATYVSVLEADGTSFVLYGHPSYGPTCTEV